MRRPFAACALACALLQGGAATAQPAVRDIAKEVIRSADNAGLPFIIVDKADARVHVFDAQGGLLGASPALLGLARGDHSVPGIGQRAISSVRPGERTTPAGRFVASMGQGPRGEDILWIDYDSSIAFGFLPPGS